MRIVQLVFAAAQALILFVLVASSWCFAGAPLSVQPWLWGGVLASLVLAFIALLWSRAWRDNGFLLNRYHALFLALGTGGLLLGGYQLLTDTGGLKMPGAVWAQELGQFVEQFIGRGQSTIYPAATRLQLGRMSLALCAFLCGALLFRETQERRLLWTVLLLNGAAVAAFGLVQKLTWDGRIYWTYPLLVGGQPFGPFVNRNGAAGYLNLCLAAGLGIYFGKVVQLTSPLASQLTTLSAHRAAFRPFHSRRALPRMPETDRLPLSQLSALGLIAAGMLATLSRGGIVSAGLAAAVVLVALAFTQHLNRRLVGVSLTGVGTLGIVFRLGFDEELWSRLQTLQLPLNRDGRLQHWTDMLPAVHDFFWRGSGWGTYYYANRPYQRSLPDFWYVNADNEYFELLVEGGIVGCLLTIGFIVWVCWLLMALLRRKLLAEAIVAGVVLISQGLQATVDFGFNLTANLITISVLLGSLAASVSIEEPDPDGVMHRVAPVGWFSRNSTAKMASIAGCLFGLIAGGAGLLEIIPAGELAKFRHALPRPDELSRIDLPTLDALLSQGEELILRRPDDAEFHVTLGRLWIERYRREAEIRLSQNATYSKSSLTEQQSMVDPMALFLHLAQFPHEKRISEVEDLKRLDPAVTNLERAAIHFQQATLSCPLIPIPAFRQSILGWWIGQDPAELLHREIFVTPSNLKTLNGAAELASLLGEDQLLCLLLKRILELDPEKLPAVVALAERRLSQAEIVTEVIPQDASLLMSFAETAANPFIREAAVSRIHSLLADSNPRPSAYWFVEARLALLQGDLAKALTDCRKAVEDDPFNEDLRLFYADLLEQQGELESALEQLRFCRTLQRGNEQMEKRIQRLYAKVQSKLKRGSSLNSEN